MPLLARDVMVNKPLRAAILTVAGLGLYTVKVNGHDASRAVLQPASSTYSRRVEYRSYDVTALLRPGKNRLGVELGTGIYDEVGIPGRYRKTQQTSGPLGMTARLDLVAGDGTTTVVDTRSGWVTRDSGTVTADWYGGEDFDARRHPVGWSSPDTPLTEAAGWQPAISIAAPVTGVLTPQAGPAVLRRPAMAARSIRQLPTGDWVVDMGAYYTGQPQISLAAPAGTKLAMFPAEALDRSGVPSQASAGAVPERAIVDTYTFAGTGIETWHPSFDYHGFRYLKVTGVASLSLRAENFSVIPVGVELPPAGGFSSDSQLLTDLDALTTASLKANMQGVYTDCPNREKLGWLEQSHLLFDLMAQRYDASEYMANTVRQIVEAQRSDGSIPEFVPESMKIGAPFYTDPNWSGAVVMLPWKLYRTYGDTATLRYAYPAMQQYLSYVSAHSQSDLVTEGLGDWITPNKQQNKTITLTMGNYRNLATMVRVATVLGRTSDAKAYSARADALKRLINSTYYTDGSYGPELTTNAMALSLGLAPDVGAVRSTLIGLMTQANTSFSMGEIGLPYIFDALHAAGRDDLLWTAVIRTTAPGYAYFTRTGSPALPEYWAGMAGSGSLAHVMLAYPGMWEFDALAGIGQSERSVGYRELVITPAVAAGPTSISATRITPQGAVAVSWVRTAGSARVKVTVPAGATATVVLPNGRHAMGPGTTEFVTPLKSSSASPGATAVSGPVYKLPWSSALWASVGGKMVHITAAQWAATGHRVPLIAMPPGSVLARMPDSPDLVARTPDGALHTLTSADWAALGHRTPVTLAMTVAKYDWAPSIFVILHWTSAPATWATHKLTPTGWARMRNPVPRSNMLIPGSRVRRGAGVHLVLVGPDGAPHLLTSAEWRKIGCPAPSI